MRGAWSGLRVTRPRALDHALRVMADDRAVPLAGGTDLFVYLNAGADHGVHYLDLWGLRELRGVRVHADRVEIGSLTTFSEIREHAVLGKRFPSLVAAAAEVGARQIQNRATVGGNIANASPAGDSLPVLLALDAEVVARSRRGERRIAFDRLYRGYRDLTLEPDELITAVVVPTPLPRSVQFFRKVGTRRAQSISKVVFCGVMRRDRTGIVDRVRLAFGSVAPTTVRARGAEESLWNEKVSPSTINAAREALSLDLAPIDDVRSDRAYRMTVAGNLVAQFLRVVATDS
jgi:CO/xanthine dehydrogenase FAD-binding subunit